MHPNCIKLELDNVPIRGQPLFAYLLLFEKSDEHGIVRIGLSRLAALIDIRHAKNLQPIIKALQDARLILYLPGNGRGHVTTFVLLFNRDQDEILSLLTEQLQMTAELAENKLSQIKFPYRQHLSRDQNRLTKGPAPAAPFMKKGPATAVPLQKGSAPTAPFAEKGPATAVPFMEKGPATAVPFTEKGPAPTVPLQKGPATAVPFMEKGPATAVPFMEKGPATAAPLQKGPAPTVPFAEKGPATAVPFAPEESPIATLDRVRVRKRAHTRFVAADIRPLSGKIKQQQQPPARVDRDPAREAAQSPPPSKFTIWKAFRLAGIHKPTADRIPAAWKQATERELTPEDVLAWHFYREAENLNLPAGRKLRPAYVIANLEEGERADATFYDQAREYLAELLHAGDDDTAHSDATPATKLALERALEAYLPPAREVGRKDHGAMRARLPMIAHDLDSRGMTADTLTDLRLYLAYTGETLPRPEKVRSTLKRIETDFTDWRQRRKTAEKLWRRALEQLRLNYASPVIRPLEGAIPLDWLSDTLILGADQQATLELLHERWRIPIQRHADLQIQCQLLQKKATEVRQLQ